VSITVSRTSCSPEDRLDVTELIAALAAEREGVPWPPTSHRLRADTARRTASAHRLLTGPTDDPSPARFRTGRRAAPLLVGLIVLGVVALVGTTLRVVPDPKPTDAALVAAPTTAPTSSAAPSPTAAPTTAPTSDPAAASPTSPTTRASKAPRTSSVATRARAADAVAAGSGSTGAGTPGVRPVHPACKGNADAPKPGDVICFTGALSDALKISVGGTPTAPIVYSGNGSTRVPGITAEADNVVIQGFVSDGADSTGIYASGKNVTVMDNTVTQVRHTDDDLDAIRFFGDGFKVLHNSVHDLEANDVGDSHVDCMQTYATSRPGSSNVVIQGNRCEGIRAQCLMAEGPNADTATGKGGGGEGVSRDWLFDGNYCDAHAEAQSVAIQDIQNVTLSNNMMAGAGHKAFALGQDSTGAVVKGNQIGTGYGREVGFDDDSARDGYQGPQAD
jgi:Right handed beta helix region